MTYGRPLRPPTHWGARHALQLSSVHFQGMGGKYSTCVYTIKMLCKLFDAELLFCTNVLTFVAIGMILQGHYIGANLAAFGGLMGVLAAALPDIFSYIDCPMTKLERYLVRFSAVCSQFIGTLGLLVFVVFEYKHSTKAYWSKGQSLMVVALASIVAASGLATTTTVRRWIGKGSRTMMDHFSSISSSRKLA